MKNYPLSVQIWIVIAIITLSISVLLAFILPSALRSFFTEEIFETIRAAQDLLFNQFEGNVYRDYIGPNFFGNRDESINNIRTVNHIIIYNDRVIVSSPVSMDFIEKVKNQALNQVDTSKEYSDKINNENIFYIISKGKALGHDAFFISYMGDSYREDLVKTLFKRLISVVIVALFFSWIPAVLLSRYLSKPLVDLEKKVEKLANNQWNEPIIIDRKDEIGKLGSSIEYLRKQLIRQDEAERTFLQHVSHELKTPVMVIQSFSEAIKDGIYPKGNLESSLDVITEESKRLEKKIKDLLYINKLNYISSHNFDKTKFSLDSLIKQVAERFILHRQDIDLKLDLDPATVEGDIDQWRVVIENLLDNQIRYAEEKILVSLKKEADKAILRFWNDGPPIEEKIMNNIFDEFNKGYKGEFGLGLAIVYRIILNHNAKIYAKNEEKGVSFYIEI